MDRFAPKPYLRIFRQAPTLRIPRFLPDRLHDVNFLRPILPLALWLSATVALAQGAPAPQPEPAPTNAELDTAWRMHNYGVLEQAATAIHPEDDARIATWFSAQVAKGGGFMTIQLAARAQWKRGLPVEPDTKGDQAALFQAATLLLYDYGALMIDAAQCKDPNARQARIEQLAAENPRIVAFIRAMPQDWRDKVVADALALEAKHGKTRRFEKIVCAPSSTDKTIASVIISETAAAADEAKQRAGVRTAIPEFAKALANQTNPAPAVFGRPAIVQVQEPSVACYPAAPLATARASRTTGNPDGDDRPVAAPGACLADYRTTKDPACLDGLLRQRASGADKLQSADETLVGVLTGVFAANPDERDRLTQGGERRPVIFTLKAEALLRAGLDDSARAMLAASKGVDSVSLPNHRRKRLPALPRPESTDAVSYLNGLYTGTGDPKYLGPFAEALRQIPDAQFSDAMRTALALQKYGDDAHAPDRPDMRAKLCARYYCGSVAKRFQETLGAAQGYLALTRAATTDQQADKMLADTLSARPAAQVIIARETALLDAYDKLVTSDTEDPRRDQALAAYERFEPPPAVEARIRVIAAHPASQDD